MFQSTDQWISLPFQDAIDIFKGRLPILSKSTHRILSDALKAKSWTIAGDHDDYTREQAKESLDVAISDGWSKGRWMKYAEEIGIPNLGKHHLETVFDTNILGAYQHGRWKQQNTPNLVKRRPYLRYKTVEDARVRPAHAALNNFTAHRDHPAWATIYPPGGFRCRCRCEALRMSDDLDITPNDQPTPTNPDTGKPAVPDEGWATNPGEWLKEPGKSQR